jgi:hypothetical protein
VCSGESGAGIPSSPVSSGLSATAFSAGVCALAVDARVRQRAAFLTVLRTLAFALRNGEGAAMGWSEGSDGQCV